VTDDDDWVAALHRTKERAEGDLMNALLRGRRRVDAADHDAEPAPVGPVDYDAGVRGSPSAPPPADMSAELRADLAARRRRQPEDYQ
jgi:hypothetical protein